ncbi:cytochrome c oxidase assembly protein [Oceanobacillus sp. CAU 1775]
MLEIILDEFHFSTLWNGGIFIYIGFIFVIYFLLLPQDKKYPIWKQLAFVLGMLAVFAALGSPINIIARIQFSTHIVQLILLLLVAPPLLIIGFKNEIIERAKEIKVLKSILSFLQKPAVGLISFFAIFYIYHIPAVFNYARLDLFINYFFMLALLFTAILLWLPIVSPNRMQAKGKQLYALLIFILFVPYSLLLFFFENSLYIVYSDAELFLQTLEACIPNLDGIPPELAASLLPFDPVYEQVKGGWFLLITQGVFFLTASLSPKFIRK